MSCALVVSNPDTNGKPWQQSNCHRGSYVNVATVNQILPPAYKPLRISNTSNTPFHSHQLYEAYTTFDTYPPPLPSLTKLGAQTKLSTCTKPQHARHDSDYEDLIFSYHSQPSEPENTRRLTTRKGANLQRHLSKGNYLIASN